MIRNPIIFSQSSSDFIETFDGKSTHWDGTCVPRKTLRAELRNYYRLEQSGYCPYCNRLRQDFHGGQWDIDHIVPKHENPQFLYEPKNLTVTCKDCNTIKRNKNVYSNESLVKVEYSVTSSDYKIIHPHMDDYDEHMDTSHDGNGRIHHTPLTDKGLVTFKTCGLNRFTEDLINNEKYRSGSETPKGLSDLDPTILDEIFDLINTEFGSLPSEVFSALLERKIHRLRGS